MRSDDGQCGAEGGDSPASAVGWKRSAVLSSSLLIVIVCVCAGNYSDEPLVWRAAGVLVVQVLWWITEVIPMSIGGLLCFVLYPLLGIEKAGALAAKFFNGTSMLFVAGFLIGLALERWNVHRRIAFSIIAVTGRRADLLVAGFMLSVWLLSMWMSNTGTILAMLPVAQAFTDTLPPELAEFKSGFVLSVGYSATIGGIATPVGTPTNTIFLGVYETAWPDAGEFPFATFVAAAFPLSLLLLILVWLGQCGRYVWLSSVPIPVDRDMFRRLLAGLGPRRWEENVVIADFAVLVVLWFTASPIGGFPGWKAYVSEQLDTGAIGLMATLPLFFIPVGTRLPQCLRRALGSRACATATPAGERAPPRHVLDWGAIKDGFMWEVLFIFGGGYMVAEGTSQSGLAAKIADALSHMEVSELGFIFVLSTCICFITEVLSNTATMQIFGPIVIATAQKYGYNPVVCLLVVTMASSFAFMLPMATPPNMAVYSTGLFDISYMAKRGFLLNVVAIVFGAFYMAAAFPGIVGAEPAPPPANASAPAAPR